MATLVCFKVQCYLVLYYVLVNGLTETDLEVHYGDQLTEFCFNGKEVYRNYSSFHLFSFWPFVCIR